MSDEHEYGIHGRLLPLLPEKNDFSDSKKKRLRNAMASLKDFILTTGLKEFIVNHYHYVTDGVLEESRDPHIYSKEEAKNLFGGIKFELNSFGSFVEWWDCFTRNHNATCEYMTCTAVLEDGQRFLIHEGVCR